MDNNYRNRLIAEATGIMSIFIVIGVAAVIRLRREEFHRELAERHKEELMSVISHELRTPASVVKSALDLVMAGDAGDISVDTRHYLGMAATNTSRLLLLVNDFLDLQKLESGHLPFNKSLEPISGIVRRAVDNNAIYAEQFGVSYQLNDMSENSTVNCDAHRIEQVLTNLLSNAAKYGGQNDIVNVTISRLDERVKIEVTDHGSGIPREFQSRVFEKFAMAKQGDRKEVNSSGLGLSIAKAIVNQHGGTIGFTSEINKGTTFHFDLPLVNIN
jgi:signal transduction histidine kinase